MLLTLPLHIPVDNIKHPVLRENNVELNILRLDRVDPEVSGNKLFKLYYFLQEAVEQQKEIITFGGAWSNHLAATASACNAAGISCIGIIRGEEPEQVSDTISFCRDKGMHLQFVSRSNYADKTSDGFLQTIHLKYPGHIVIPEGGYGAQGVKGAALINQYIENTYTHICCPIGTATTFAGVLSAAHTAEVIGFSALKGLNDLELRLNDLLPDLKINYLINDQYHFGGFAKKSPELIEFMNEFYLMSKEPLDFVYTGKMMFGISDMVSKNYFKPGSRILAIHTGGLQGNRSLKAGELVF